MFDRATSQKIYERVGARFPILRPAWSDLPWLVAFTVRARFNAADDVRFDFMTGGGEGMRLQLAESLGSLRVTWLTLEHKARIVRLDAPAQSAPTADAAIITAANNAVAFTTADCLPVIIAHESAPVAAAIHAGWRSLAAGVIESCIEQLSAQDGLNPAQMRAWIGPAIAACDYEVTSEVRERLLERPAVNSSCFTSTAPGHHLANLALAATLILKYAGLKSQSISHCTLSTKTDPRLHSHRRDGQDSGRMATVVGITA